MHVVTGGDRLTAPPGMDRPVTMSAILRKHLNELQVPKDISIYYNIF